MPDASQLRPPRHLSRTAKAWWATVNAEFELLPHHAHILSLAAQALDRCEQARQILKRDGLIISTADGSMKAHPAVAIERDARTAFVRICRELRLDDDALGDPDRVPPLKAYRS